MFITTLWFLTPAKSKRNHGLHKFLSMGHEGLWDNQRFGWRLLDWICLAVARAAIANMKKNLSTTEFFG